MVIAVFVIVSLIVYYKDQNQGMNNEHISVHEYVLPVVPRKINMVDFCVFYINMMCSFVFRITVTKSALLLADS